MSELDPRVARLLDSARQTPPVDPELATRLWARLGSSTATAALVSMSTVKLWLAVVAAGSLSLGAGAGYVVGRSTRQPPVSAEVEVRVAQALPPPVAPLPAPPLPAPAPLSTPQVAPPSVKPAEPSTLERERALLDRARAALRRDLPAEAKATLLRHRALFAQGALAEERDALEVQVLVSLGEQDQAKQRARAFLERYPSSIFRDAVELAVPQ